MIIPNAVAREHIVTCIAKNITYAVHNLPSTAYLINAVDLKYLHISLSMPVSKHQYIHNRTASPAPYNYPRPIRSTTSRR